jgi:hypothetical protein
MRKISFYSMIFCFFFLCHSLQGQNVLYLRDNLKLANPGDYIVTAQGKAYTLLHIHDRIQDRLTIEEITVPMSKINSSHFSWKEWVANHAPSNTSWIIYSIDLVSGQMVNNFSFTKNTWYKVTESDNFLSTLLNLRLIKVPPNERKKIGGSTGRWWQPQMVVNGNKIMGVKFDAWRTRWPKDGSDLAGRTIEVYVPEENGNYPSYFPYWLQISGMIGKAKIRIIDSGSHLISPKEGIPQL